MLMYMLLRLKYLFIERAVNQLPDIQIVFPDYHSDFENIVDGIGYFIDLDAISILFTLWASYMLFRIAISLWRGIRGGS